MVKADFFRLNENISIIGYEKENGIELIYFTEKKFVKFEKSKNKVFTSINEIIEYINSKN